MADAISTVHSCHGIASHAPARAAQGVADRVRLMRGSEAGEVTDMTPYEVTLNKGLPGSREIAVNEIKAILFDDEPSELSQARVNAANGAYENALAIARKDRSRHGRTRFHQAGHRVLQGAGARPSCALPARARSATPAGSSTPSSAAIRKISTTLAAREAMGDLLMAGGGYENAEKQYAELAKAPWPDYKMRAAVAVGRSLQAQNKHAEAIQQFDAALAMPDDGADAQNQRLAATLGKAVSLAETGGVDEAVGIIEKVIQDADPEQKELHARAYNALGKCYEKAGQTKDALVWPSCTSTCSTTRCPKRTPRRSRTWRRCGQAIGQDERAAKRGRLLNERYGGSRWAKAVQ